MVFGQFSGAGTFSIVPSYQIIEVEDSDPAFVGLDIYTIISQEIEYE
jgi:hypothetical protein